jgi:hypothetical protein
MKTLALLVAVNRYQDTGISTLGGCVNDVNRFEQYLLTALNVPQINILKLFDKQATKANIVAAFQQHFALAQSDDVCIFYFAGHGVRQETNAAFRVEDINDKMECLACHDTNFKGGGLLADKEQRWLMHQLAKKSGGCHILTLYDCCHSGDNTRAIGGESDVKVRMIKTRGDEELVMPQRPWRDFIFAKTLTEATIAKNAAMNNKLDVVMPQGAHIQLAACGINELAKEGGGHGYFSSNLLDLLESSNGKMTYFDLRSLMCRRLSNLPIEKRQTPQFYAVESSIFQPFLGGSTQTSLEATVNFNAEKSRWEMNMGSIYGIFKGATVFVTLPHKRNEAEAATVETVYHDYSVLTFANENSPVEQAKPAVEKRIRRTDNYKAATGKFSQTELKIACVAPSITARWAAFSKKYTAVLENALLKNVATPAQADYVLNTEGAKIFIARPDAPTRPLVEMINDAGTDNAFNKIVIQLIAAGRWEFVKMQKSASDSDVLLKDISINFTFKNQTTDLKTVEKINCPITTYEVRKDWDLNLWNELLSIKITNNHPTENRYIAGIWLSEVFGIDPRILKNSPIALPIEPTKSVSVFDETFNLLFSDHILLDKWDKFYNYLKVYVSESPFDLTQFQQADLLHPRKGVSEIESDRLIRKAESVMPKTPLWVVKTVAFELDVSALKK